MNSDTNLGSRVKWIDPQDNGWRTGRVVLMPPDGSGRERGGILSDNGSGKSLLLRQLVRESCDGRLSWVDFDSLQDLPDRSERQKFWLDRRAT